MVEKRSQTLQTITLNSASFIAQFAISMVNFSLIYHLRAMFSLSAQMIGIAASTYTLSYFFFCIMLEQPCSHIRPRHCVEVSMIGMSLSIIWIIGAENLAGVLCFDTVRTVHGDAVASSHGMVIQR